MESPGRHLHLTHDDIASLDESQDDDFILPTLYHRNEVGIINNEDYHEDELRKHSYYDAHYSQEFGYGLVQALRGDSIGRQIKREICVFGLIQLLVGFILMCIVTDNTTKFSGSYLYSNKYGISLFNLTWLVAFPSFFNGIISLVIIHYYKHLCTNRYLIRAIVRAQLIYYLFDFMFTIWNIVAMFLLFKNVDWNHKENLTYAESLMYSGYVSTLVLEIPYAAAIAWYGSDLSFLTDEINDDGIFAEPGVDPSTVVDMSDVTFTRLLLSIIAIPLTYGLQLYDLINAIKRALIRFYHERTAAEARRKEEEKMKGTKKNKGLLRRVTKTISRRCGWVMEHCPCRLMLKHVVPSSASGGVTDNANTYGAQLQLQSLNNDNNNEVLASAPVLDNVAVDINPVEYNEQKVEPQLDVVLTLDMFKQQWSTVPIAGAFQTRLKEMPAREVVVCHLENQGFYIVFCCNTPNESSPDVEIGLCNIRNNEQEAWFLARFLISPQNFSAVMKASDVTNEIDQNPMKNESVKKYVRLFQFAKILKMDTSTAT